LRILNNILIKKLAVFLQIKFSRLKKFSYLFLIIFISSLLVSKEGFGQCFTLDYGTPPPCITLNSNITITPIGVSETCQWIITPPSGIPNSPSYLPFITQNFGAIGIWDIQVTSYNPGLCQGITETFTIETFPTSQNFDIQNTILNNFLVHLIENQALNNFLIHLTEKYLILPLNL
jgi:hypothetical protein